MRRSCDYVVEQELPVKLLNIALPDEYVEHGNVALLYEEVGIDAEICDQTDH